MNLPTPHLGKLNILLSNNRQPEETRQKAEEALGKYRSWIASSLELRDKPEDVKKSELVRLLNGYKKFIEYDLIFMDRSDFLYRQKGQLKLDNTILEEFFPLCVYVMYGSLLENSNLELGPAKSFSGIFVNSPMDISDNSIDVTIKQKDQDFAIYKPMYFAASHNADLSDAIVKSTNIAYLAAECKTNLDKTMFQEAAATALSLKTNLPTAKYFLICEWLDMTPISASTTAIDEVLVLRKAKRLGSDIRSNFSTFAGRNSQASFYLQHLESHPIDADIVGRFLDYAKSIIGPAEDSSAISRGFF